MDEKIPPVEDKLKNPELKNKFSKNRNLIITAVIFLIILVGIGLILFLNKSTKLNESTQVSQVPANNAQESFKNTCTSFGQTVEVQNKSAEGAFINALTDPSLIDHISPGDQTGDKRFTYIWIKGSQGVPVFAPANGTLVQIIYKNRTDLGSSMSEPDYDLVFLVDCNTFYRINHVTNPVSSIKSQSPITTPMELKPGSGINDADTIPKSNIMVKAGEQLGTTTGTPNAHNFDFGVFVNQQATCPYNEFIDPIKSTFLELFKGASCSPSGNY